MDRPRGFRERRTRLEMTTEAESADVAVASTESAGSIQPLCRRARKVKHSVPSPATCRGYARLLVVFPLHRLLSSSLSPSPSAEAACSIESVCGNLPVCRGRAAIWDSMARMSLSKASKHSAQPSLPCLRNSTAFSPHFGHASFTSSAPVTSFPSRRPERRFAMGAPSLPHGSAPSPGRTPHICAIRAQGPFVSA